MNWQCLVQGRLEDFQTLISRVSQYVNTLNKQLPSYNGFFSQGQCREPLLSQLNSLVLLSDLIHMSHDFKHVMKNC